MRLALVLAEISVETLCVLKKGPVAVNVKQSVSARQSCTQVGVRGHSRRAQSSVAGDSVTTARAVPLFSLLLIEVISARAVPLFRLHTCADLRKENVVGHGKCRRLSNMFVVWESNSFNHRGVG